MPPDLIIFHPPALHDIAGVGHVVDPVLIKALVPELAPEASHVAVLLRLAGLDEGVLHAVSVAPLVELHPGELGAVAGVNSTRLALEPDQFV